MDAIEYKCKECGAVMLHTVLTSYPGIDQWECPNCGRKINEQRKIMEIEK